MPRGPPKGTFEIRKRKFQKKHGIGYGSAEQLAEEARRAEAGREIELARSRFQSTRSKKPVERKASSRVAQAKSSDRLSRKAKAVK